MMIVVMMSNTPTTTTTNCKRRACLMEIKMKFSQIFNQLCIKFTISSNTINPPLIAHQRTYLSSKISFNYISIVSTSKTSHKNCIHVPQSVNQNFIVSGSALLSQNCHWRVKLSRRIQHIQSPISPRHYSQMHIWSNCSSHYHVIRWYGSWFTHFKIFVFHTHASNSREISLQFANHIKRPLNEMSVDSDEPRRRRCNRITHFTLPGAAMQYKWHYRMQIILHIFTHL